ncbi:hypothetical protein Bsp3421_003915 [Burkholderia sp. FERM BP-3421]|jgi:hypothetical protein|uniref:hypothetical protein n=1 Tax=Burkholderia sp. FERM BP-3421 TaxID=1494466 RepID=UPI002361D98A|nr:hypothetical protein [Burkholderia sp. FERM BP-3421]WDD93815.1 hypothetical protein Bsp3421_003915 [Burkholderia sp. FERM BP-3421]
MAKDGILAGKPSACSGKRTFFAMKYRLRLAAAALALAFVLSGCGVFCGGAGTNGGYAGGCGTRMSF